jgi:hypothetical protein
MSGYRSASTIAIARNLPKGFEPLGAKYRHFTVTASYNFLQKG